MDGTVTATATVRVRRDAPTTEVEPKPASEGVPPLRRAAATWTILSLLAADVEPILIKLGYQTNATPLQFLALKTLMAALLIYPLTRQWKWLGWGELRRIAPVSVLLLITNALMLVGLKYATVVTALTIVTSTPAMVALVNRARGRERHTPRFWVGFVLCFGGVALTIDLARHGLSASGPGILALVGAVITSTVYRTAMEDLTRRHPPLLISTTTFFINGIIVALLVLPWIWPIPTAAVGIGLWIGCSGALANVAFLAALQLIGATRISILNMLQRPLIIVVAAIVFHEPLTWAQIVGVVAVITGVQLARVRRR